MFIFLKKHLPFPSSVYPVTSVSNHLSDTSFLLIETQLISTGFSFFKLYSVFLFL